MNSLHWQGVDRLAPDLAVEARANDGLVEAFRVKSAPTFALAVQWHPEERLDDLRLFAAAVEASAAYANGRARV